MQHNCDSSNLFFLQGYSYVAPSILFTENVISDSLFKTSTDRRPSTTNLMACSFKVSTSLLTLPTNSSLVHVSHMLSVNGKSELGVVLC